MAQDRISIAKQTRRIIWENKGDSIISHENGSAWALRIDICVTVLNFQLG